mgnify:CR=1 FL=1
MSNPRASSVVTLRDRTYPAIVALIVGLFRLLRFRMTVVGAEHIPLAGGAVLAANHTGFLDFCFVGAAARKKKRLVRFMCKREVFDNPLGGPVMRSMHHIPVDRDAGSGAFGVALKYLRSGELVGIFPEGSISRSFEPMSFMPGATALAAGASVPLIPMAVWGSQRIWTKATFRALRFRRIPVTIICGEPMTFERREDHAAATQRVRHAVVDLLQQAQADYPDQPRTTKDSWWLPARLGGTAPTPEAALTIEQQRRAHKAASAHRAGIDDQPKDSDGSSEPSA